MKNKCWLSVEKNIANYGQMGMIYKQSDEVLSFFALLAK